MNDLYDAGDGDKAIVADYPASILRIYKRKFNHLPWPLWQLLVLKGPRIIYNPIAKTGSSSLRSTIVDLSDLPPETKRLPLDTYATGIQLGDFSADEAREILQSPTYFRFAVIRDPFDRLVSAYLDKFVLNRMSRGNHFHCQRVISEVLGVSAPTESHFRRSISFSQFVDYIVRQPPQSLDPHWCPQHLYLRGAVYSLVRFEDIEALYAELAIRCGVPAAVFRQNATRQNAEFVEAAHSLAAEDLPHANIATTSFNESTIRSKVQSYFHADLALIEQAAVRYT